MLENKTNLYFGHPETTPTFWTLINRLALLVLLKGGEKAVSDNSETN